MKCAVKISLSPLTFISFFSQRTFVYVSFTYYLEAPTAGFSRFPLTLFILLDRLRFYRAVLHLVQSNAHFHFTNVKITKKVEFSYNSIFTSSTHRLYILHLIERTIRCFFEINRFLAKTFLPVG